MFVCCERRDVSDVSVCCERIDVSDVFVPTCCPLTDSSKKLSGVASASLTLLPKSM